MIELQHITQRYRTPEGGEFLALDDVSLTIEAGEIFGIIGRSGAGKSTLVRCINFLNRPTEGTVVIDGKCLNTMSEAQLRAARRKIGMIFQHFNLLSSRTVFENAVFPLELAGVDAGAARAKVDALLDLVGLSEHRNKYPSQLSGGQKQRVGIARALANDPEVLLSDEATRPVISEASRIYNINFNILLGQIDEVQGRGFGTLTVLTACSNDVFSGLLDYLRRHNVTVEEITDHVL